jgi:Flp pilus assembly protein TadG
MKVQKDMHGQTEVLPRGLNRAAAACRTSVKAQSIGGRLRASFRGGDEGQSLVELAVLLPVLLMVLTGILSCGFALWNYVTLDQGAAQAAQFLADGGETNNTNGDSTLSDPCQSAFSQITEQATGLNPSNITVTYTMNGTTVGPFTGTAANTCRGDASYLGSGNVTVTATYPCKIGVYGVSFSSSCLLTSKKTELSY